ncbi:MAG: AMP-binding protein [Syntrophobacteraceae bacterium]
MAILLEGCTPYRQQDAEKYDRLRWWPGLTLSDLLDRAADIYPHKEAFVDGKCRLTFSEAREKTDRLAIGLMDLGIKPLDRVLIQLPNWNEFVFVYFALQKIGAVTVLLIDRYRQYEINHIAKMSGATTWIVARRYAKVDYLPIIDDVLKESPQLKRVILARAEGGEPFSDIDDLIGKNELSEGNIRRLAEARPDPMQIAHMGVTGGTTGIPKIVPRTHNSLVCSSEFCARAWDMDIHDNCLLAGPIGHDLTFSKGLLGSVPTFGKITFLDTTDMEEVCKTIEAEKITVIVWVPTLSQRLLIYEKLGDFDLSSLRGIHCGGGASLPDMVRGVQEKLGAIFYNAYGGTEGMTTISRTNDDLETILNTVGKPTCPYDTYKVVDPFGEDLPPDTPGELLLKGPGVFTGYYNNPTENKLVFTQDGFFRTGDVAKISREGYIVLTGRIKEMINRGGESISATEIERLILDHPDVAQVAVVPMPDPDLGEKVCAYIQVMPKATLTFEDVISFLRGRKASVLQLPQRIEFIDAFPYTKAGKLDKATLREDIAQKVAEAGAQRGSAQK